MAYDFLESYCLQKPGATRDWQPEWQATRYMVGGKMFVMDGGDKNEVPIVTVKLDPLRGDAARKQYASVIPGHYMNKLHWNSIYHNGDVPNDVLKDMIDESYRLVVAGLPKKTQKEIAGE